MSVEERSTIDFLAQAIVAGFTAATGQEYEYGAVGRFSDQRIMGRRVPIRAVQVTFESGLEDCMVMVTSVREERALAATSAAALEIVDQLRVPVQVADPAMHEFASADDAFEQLEALYNEACLEFSGPGGDILVIFGTDMLRSASPLVTAAKAGAADFGPRKAEQPDSDPRIPTPPQGNLRAVPNPDEADARVDAMFARDPQRIPEVQLPPTMTIPLGAVTHTTQTLQLGDARWTSLLTDVEVEVSAELGRTELALGSFDVLDADSVLTLDQSVDEPVTVFVNGAPYASARMIVVDGCYGLEIIEILPAESLQLI